MIFVGKEWCLNRYSGMILNDCFVYSTAYAGTTLLFCYFRMLAENNLWASPFILAAPRVIRLIPYPQQNKEALLSHR